MSYDFEEVAKRLYYAYSETEIVEELKRAFQEGAAMEADKIIKRIDERRTNQKHL
jgi:hypothetical protein